jgi:hypothetical protein
MSWDVSIVKGVDARVPLGSREFVVAAVANALPGIVMECPPIPPQEMLDMMPETIREGALNPCLEATYDVGNLSIRFYALNQPVVHWINAEVRGNEDPLPVLASVCRPNEWSVVDASDKQIVDLDSASESAWHRFRKWRDFAFQQGKARDSSR